MASVNDLLKGMDQSLASTYENITKIIDVIDSQEHPELVQELLKDEANKLENVSLLDLKNNCMTAYLNEIILIILAQLERINERGDKSVDSIRGQAIERSIIQRVTLERGIKPLEKKLNYQLEKMVTSYHKMETDSKQVNNGENARSSKDVLNSDSHSSDSESDELSYRPDASTLLKNSLKTTTSESYKPPKISAMAPPSTQTEPRNNSKKLQSMEEFLKDSSDLPLEEKSIGVNIVNHGRGGIKTNKDREKERELQRYEEDNFIRLPTTVSKTDKHKKRKDMENTFAGEDWSMFSNSRNISNSTSRKRKATSAWDKVKRKR